jgi:hypothetical protein
MKTLILIPIAVALALAGAAVLCLMAGLPPHTHDLATAAVVAVVAAEVGLLPAWAMRRAEPVKQAQAALGGTVLHMFLTILLGAAVVVAKVVEPREPFVYWLTGAYWTSLAMLVWGLVRLLPGRRPSVKGN